RQLPCPRRTRYTFKVQITSFTSPALQFPLEAWSPSGISSHCCRRSRHHRLSPCGSAMIPQFRVWIRFLASAASPSRIYWSSVHHQKGVAELDLRKKGNPAGKLKVRLQRTDLDEVVENMHKDTETLVPGDSTSRIIDVREAAAKIPIATALEGVTPLLKNIIDFGGRLAQVHPYASAAWSILTAVYEAVKEQHETDSKVVKLILAMVEVYSFAKDVKYLTEKIKSLETTVTAIGLQTLECAIFIREYTGHGFTGRSFG
ncbi:hypothetical protein K438DRAFT_2051378, partial [Mycena galopus ATCC 62051]